MLLPDGKVLVAGGAGPRDKPTDSAELYDPVTGAWTAIANMQALHGTFDRRPLLLRDGKVLVVGPGANREVYDPATGTWTALAADPSSATARRRCCRMAPCCVTAGENPMPTLRLYGAALYDPQTGSSTTAASMPRCATGPRSRSCSMARSSWQVAATATASGACVSNGAAELYVPAGVPLPPFRLPEAASANLPEPDPEADAAPARRPVPFRRTHAPGPSR